jgi:hypothetical protein
LDTASQLTLSKGESFIIFCLSSFARFCI